MVLEQVGGLNRGLVSAADENDAAALKLHRGCRRDWLGGGRQQRCHLWSRLFCLTRPAGGLANVAKLYWVLAANLGSDIREQDCLLGTSYRQRAIFGGDRLEAIKLSTTEM